MINLSCRSQFLRIDVIDKLKSVFSSVFTKKVTDDINEIIYALPSSSSVTHDSILTENGDLVSQMEQNLETLQQLVSRKMKDKSKVDLKESLQGLEILL